MLKGLFDAVNLNDIEKLKKIFMENKDRNNFSLDYTNMKGNTLLIEACIKGNYDFVEFLITNGADINKQGEDGVSALMLASANSKIYFTTSIRSGGEINRLVKDGDSVLMVALLLENGADFNLKTNNGVSALDIANMHKHTLIGALLEKYELQATIDTESKAEPTGPAKTYADRSALELKKLKTKSVERDSELSMGL